MAIRLSPAQEKVVAAVLRATLADPETALVLSPRQRRSLQIAYEKVQNANASHRPGRKPMLTERQAERMLEEAAEAQANGFWFNDRNP